MPSAVPKTAVFDGTSYIAGTASGVLKASKVELSFWGGVNPATGEVIDRHHPLSGQCLQDTILAIPGARGSCGGSTIMMELLSSGKGPKAIIFERREEILTLGVILAQEFFSKSIPVIGLKPEEFRQILGWHGKEIFVEDGRVSDSMLEKIPSDHATHAGGTLEAQLTALKLATADQAYLDGSHGEGSRIAMRVLLKMANLMDAEELIDVSQVHIDACLYAGPASVAVAEKYRDMGGKVRVPTTINAISVDQRRWRSLGVDVPFGDASSRIANAYTDMGASPTFTCAPYQLDTAPKKGEMVGWGESNAVIYANSVLGARTMKYPDYLDVAVALTGRAPKAGVYVDEYRKATLQINVSTIQKEIDDSFWPVLGYAAGAIACNRIAAITGIEHLTPSKDDLKAFGAAYGTSSGAPMFHLVGITPEAPTLAAAIHADGKLDSVELDRDALTSCWKEFNPATTRQKVDLISLGNPHLSLREIRTLAELSRGRQKHEDVEIVVTCGRATSGLATQAGLVAELEQFGVQFLNDTCWCFIAEPIIPRPAKVIMTNSGKYAHYGPGLTGRQFCFGSLAMCMDAACDGNYAREMPPWLSTHTR